jgi:hypothetical protein
MSISISWDCHLHSYLKTFHSFFFTHSLRLRIFCQVEPLGPVTPAGGTNPTKLIFRRMKWASYVGLAIQIAFLAVLRFSFPPSAIFVPLISLQHVESDANSLNFAFPFHFIPSRRGKILFTLFHLMPSLKNLLLRDIHNSQERCSCWRQASRDSRHQGHFAFGPQHPVLPV